MCKVQSLNSTLLTIATELGVKTKGQKCSLSKQDNVDLVVNAEMITAAFDDMALWSFNRREGLTASGIRPLELSNNQVQRIIGGHHVQN